MDEVEQLVASYATKKKRLDDIAQERKALLYQHNDVATTERLENLEQSHADEIQMLLSEMFTLAKAIGYRNQEIFHAEYGLRQRAIERHQSDLQSEIDPDLKKEYLERIRILQAEIDELKHALLESVSVVTEHELDQEQ